MIHVDTIHHELTPLNNGELVHHLMLLPLRQGIFGLSHKQLLASEWVENDALTVKFELEVRPDDWQLGVSEFTVDRGKMLGGWVTWLVN